MEKAESADACVECEGGWSLAGSAVCTPCSGGVCLKGPMDWHSARAECLSLGTDLPMESSNEANGVLFNVALHLGAESIWLRAGEEAVLQSFTTRDPLRPWLDFDANDENRFACEGDLVLYCPPSSQPDLINGGCEPCPDECQPCPAGTYKDDSSASPCADCPTDTFNPSEASTSVADCAACPSSHPTSADASVAFSSCKLPVDNALTATLKLLDLRNNSIARLPYEVMDVESPELNILLDGNPCTRELDWSDLEVNRLPLRLQRGYESMGWEVEVRTVKLGGNRLDESVFEKLLDANFTNIEELDVSRNALGGLPKEEVRGLKKLRKLDISTLPAGIFDELGELIVLTLQRNSLEKLPPSLFADTPNLVTLYLNDNSLSNLPAGIFDDLGELTRLQLQGNPLETLPPRLFADTANLGILDVTGLNASAFANDTFAEYPFCLVMADDSMKEVCFAQNPNLNPNVEEVELLPLVHLGVTASCIPNCGACVGDCDSDADCSEGLKCFERDRSDQQVPGCSMGGPGNVGDHDYCYDPSFGSKRCIDSVWSIIIHGVGTGSGTDWYINLSEVQAFDSTGAIIVPTGVAMSSEHSPQYSAENCIDGDLESMCHSKYDEEYLRVDYAGDVSSLANIVVTNRNDGNDCCEGRIVGATIRVVVGRPASNALASASALWEAEFTDSAPVYNFAPASLSCSAAYHAWDFRSCNSSVPVVDSSGGVLAATLKNGAACTAEGVAFDGVDDYVDLDDWEWGGGGSIEVFVKKESGWWSAWCEANDGYTLKRVNTVITEGPTGKNCNQQHAGNDCWGIW
ncbi:hypothetical protein TeGR_g9858, partial [Tetraparma gracilis]